MIVASDLPVTGLAAAKRAVGGKAKDLATRLNITGAAISRWKGVIPDAWLFKVEKATGVPHYILRPDLFAKHDAGAKKGRAA